MSEIEYVSTGVGSLPVVRTQNGDVRVVLKTAVEAMGLSYSGARERLNRRSWAKMRVTPMVASDGKIRRVNTISIDTWIMFLATVDESRVSDEVRPVVVEFQEKSARALRDFWLKGVAVNDSATVQQLQEAVLNLKDDLEAAGYEVEGAREQLAQAYERGMKAARMSSAYDTHGFNPYADGRTFPIPPKRPVKAVTYENGENSPTFHYGD